MVTVPFANGRFEPLCAVYRKSFAGIAEKALASGKNSVHELFSRAVARVVSEEEIVESGFGLEMFWNVNTRDDLARLQAKSKLETKAEDFNRKGRSERF
jgi:molybdopterin-guanine dinucleotide biosynthesis protein A